jgi:hypothetical protein
MSPGPFQALSENGARRAHPKARTAKQRGRERLKMADGDLARRRHFCVKQNCNQRVTPANDHHRFDSLWTSRNLPKNPKPR